jgi:aminoglycoside/choline kinase family phosphotransferase
MGKILQDNAIFVPKVIATLPDFAALIIDDYGDLMLEGLVKADGERSPEVRARYETAVRIISKFLRIPANQNQIWCQRSFDDARFAWELNFLKEKYLEPIAGIDFSGSRGKAFDADTKALSAFLAKYSKYFVHRDYHSRNIMVERDFIAVLDFQDARLGPPAYDLVSLVFDSYVDFSKERRMGLMEFSKNLIFEKAGTRLVEEIEETWRPTLLQRQWKAIGSFGYLTLEKNRGDYLKYVGPALNILKDSQVEDPRWPFISGTLVEAVREYLRGLSDGQA